MFFFNFILFLCIFFLFSFSISDTLRIVLWSLEWRANFVGFIKIHLVLSSQRKEIPTDVRSLCVPEYCR